eukprot:jgi/Ulvmu1/2518/UM138_0023.1
MPSMHPTRTSHPRTRSSSTTRNCPSTGLPIPIHASWRLHQRMPVGGTAPRLTQRLMHGGGRVLARQRRTAAERSMTASSSCSARGTPSHPVSRLQRLPRQAHRLSRAGSPRRGRHGRPEAAATACLQLWRRRNAMRPRRTGPVAALPQHSTARHSTGSQHGAPEMAGHGSRALSQAREAALISKFCVRPRLVSMLVTLTHRQTRTLRSLPARRVSTRPAGQHSSTPNTSNSSQRHTGSALRQRAARLQQVIRRGPSHPGTKSPVSHLSSTAAGRPRSSAAAAMRLWTQSAWGQSRLTTPMFTETRRPTRSCRCLVHTRTRLRRRRHRCMHAQHAVHSTWSRSPRPQACMGSRRNVRVQCVAQSRVRGRRRHGRRPLRRAPRPPARPARTPRETGGPPAGIALATAPVLAARSGACRACQRLRSTRTAPRQFAVKTRCRQRRYGLASCEQLLKSSSIRCQRAATERLAMVRRRLWHDLSQGQPSGTVRPSQRGHARDRKAQREVLI